MTTLKKGSRGNDVKTLQNKLNITADGIFGPATKAAVQKFQSVFGLPATGVVDYPTWYKISEIYVAVSRIAELM